jgi:hypothetical protein
LKIFAERCGLVDFSRLTGEIAARLNAIGQKHGLFPPQSKCLTHSATEKSTSPERIPLRKNQPALDAVRYGKINRPSVGW